MMYVIGPGHGGPAIAANTWLEGSYSDTYPDVSRDAAGMARLFRQFSFPGGIPSHVAPELPGSIHEGGELGYSLSHAYGAVLDNPDLVVACVIGDGEAETGPLATSWHSNKFLDPRTDGAVLPILHLNGYKIANPAVLARIGDDELTRLLEGYGYRPYLVEGDEPEHVHQALALTLDQVLDEIAEIQAEARATPGHPAPPLADDRAAHPQGLDRSARGRRRTGRGNLAIAPGAAGTTYGPRRSTCACSRTGCAATGRRNCSTPTADRSQRLLAQVPRRDRRMGSSPHSNGGLLSRDLELPELSEYAVPVARPGRNRARAHSGPRRLPARRDARQPGRTGTSASSVRTRPPPTGWTPLYDVTGKAWNAEVLPTDEHLAVDGRVMEILSEHTCQGWLEGYLLTGRHGWFSCYEAFVHIVDSMVNQHAKWLKVTRALPWRRPIPSLNYLLTSHVWRQDHNGFSHQDPGFIDHVVNKKAEVIRVYLPPDTNTLLSTAEHCLRSHDYINVIVAGKQPQADWLDPEAAALHCARGARRLGLRQQRRRRPGCGDGVRGRRTDAGDARRGQPAARTPAVVEDPGRQRGRPDAAAAGQRASRTACPTRTSTRCSRPTSRSSSPTTATRG